VLADYVPAGQQGDAELAIGLSDHSGGRAWAPPPARENPQLVEDVRVKMLAAIETVRKAPPPKPVERWAVADRYVGIERADLVVVNVRDERERDSTERLVSDVARLRTDEDLFRTSCPDAATASGSPPSWRTWSSRATRG
jgi:hypothetical protein